MKTRVQKWGNSLALRIPKAVAHEVGLADKGLVEIGFVKGELTVRPARRPALTLKQLLAGITPKNRHAENESGAPCGREAW